MLTCDTFLMYSHVTSPKQGPFSRKEERGPWERGCRRVDHELDLIYISMYMLGKQLLNKMADDQRGKKIGIVWTTNRLLLPSLLVNKFKCTWRDVEKIY